MILHYGHVWWYDVDSLLRCITALWEIWRKGTHTSVIVITIQDASRISICSSGDIDVEAYKTELMRCDDNKVKHRYYCVLATEGMGGQASQKEVSSSDGNGLMSCDVTMSFSGWWHGARVRDVRDGKRVYDLRLGETVTTVWWRMERDYMSDGMKCGSDGVMRGIVKRFCSILSGETVYVCDKGVSYGDTDHGKWETLQRDYVALRESEELRWESVCEDFGPIGGEEDAGGGLSGIIGKLRGHVTVDDCYLSGLYDSLDMSAERMDSRCTHSKGTNIGTMLKEMEEVHGWSRGVEGDRYEASHGLVFYYSQEDGGVGYG
ncbi:hypothetical protein Tco_0500006 [Tanacetum coccineum]